MRASELRSAWTNFFVERGHTAVPSSSLIPTHPSAPMFTNSGMMQFVPYFLGEEPVPFDPRRATSVQRCVRAGGKHNDLDAIGRSLRHLSFFEMLGNFSFGDYFKAEAIPWAWEMVTEVLGIDGDRVWVTVHESDDEAEDIWADAVGVPRDRIQRLGKDNFWEMGETGPCGPSSELFFDFGPEWGPDGGPANPAAEERYVEFYNNVFPQYFRRADGSLTDLENRGIDVGAGLERILGVLAGSPSLYVADSLATLVDEAQGVTGHRLGESDLGDIALRLLADHTRTMTFLIADGVIPSNEDRGYVLRRIIRRAIRFAYLLDVETPVCPPLVERCIDVMGDDYPEIVNGRDLVLGIVSREEDRFRQTLRTGSQTLDTELDKLDEGGTLPGAVAFQLHDTYGFPLEVTQEVAELRGFGVDRPGFEAAMTEQRERAKAGRKGGGAASEDAMAEYQRILAEHGPTVFTGREEESTTATIVAIVGDDLFLDRTPFYAESGGQVGDTGQIQTDSGVVEVLDTTYALPGLHRHRFQIIEGEVAVGQTALAGIDAERRAAIRRNHTGTHILHWALRQVLGDHVKQQGSLVAPDRLRFDFSHFEALTDEEIAAIEDLANQEILSNAPVRHYETSKEEAERLGAIAFFGDKYGERVRVLEAGLHSVELCGGTHVSALGDIGPMKIVSEGSIGSNLRRIEAVTGTGPIDRLRAEERLLGRAAELVGVNADELVEGIEKRLAELKDLRDELRAVKQQAAAGQAGTLAAEAVDGVVVARRDGVARDELRDLAIAVREQPGIRGVVLGGAPEGGGVAIVAAVTPDSGLHASDLIADAAKRVKGGTGKNAELAMAGGRDPSALDEALDLVRAALAAA
ncbi:alanine--tRNA ligase [Actinomarinicola tropica]|uniref:Alanine--tRNA ligase n=1 Tax=Actinomarinicola tropica TaxID=2789776 RepID=A0A5Q2RPM3_9ACTN|nr:alanine--tRNA ligase [Actinomarinicola tropica]QGG95165.1 alanine--tRNA ligase [Actinomarinicola tropica]